MSKFLKSRRIPRMDLQRGTWNVIQGVITFRGLTEDDGELCYDAKSLPRLEVLR